MNIDAQKLEALQKYKALEKFPETVWTNRGLPPSSGELRETLEKAFNLLGDQLYVAIETGFSAKLLKEILHNSLKKHDAFEYGKEERELIGDNFHQLAEIVGINLTQQLNKWLHGDTVSNFMKLYRSRNE